MFQAGRTKFIHGFRRTPYCEKFSLLNKESNVCYSKRNIGIWLKVLTRKSFLFRTPKSYLKNKFQKKTLKNDLENPSRLLLILAGSLLLPFMTPAFSHFSC